MTTPGPMGNSTVSATAVPPGLDTSQSMGPVASDRVGGTSNSLGRDRVVAEYEAHLRSSGLPPNTPVDVRFTPVRPTNPFHATGAIARPSPNIFRRGWGVSGPGSVGSGGGGRQTSDPGSVASGRGGGAAGSGSVASGRGGGAAGGVGQGRGGGGAGGGATGQGRGGAAAGGVMGGRVGDQGRGGGVRGGSGVRERSRGRAAQARLEASLQRTRDGRGWTTHGQSHLAAENEDPQESRLGLAHPQDQDTGPGDAPGDEDPVADQALDDAVVDAHGRMGEGEPEDQREVAKMAEGRSEDQADMMEEEKEAHEETLHALRLENEALKMENKAAQAQMQAAKFDNEAKELRRQAQVLALEKDVKMLRAQLQQYQGASVLPNP